MNAVADERGLVLATFAKALQRESHNLRERPELLSQPLYDLLEWGEGSVEERLAAQRDRRSVQGARPWLRTLTRFPESEALIGTLVDHTAGVAACAYSPDGRWIVSASTDHTLKRWDANSSASLPTLKGHRGWVTACAYRPDGRLVVTGGRTWNWEDSRPSRLRDCQSKRFGIGRKDS